MNKANTRPDLVDKWAAVSSPLKNSHGTLRTWTTSVLCSLNYLQHWVLLHMSFVKQGVMSSQSWALKKVITKRKVDQVDSSNCTQLKGSSHSLKLRIEAASKSRRISQREIHLPSNDFQWPKCSFQEEYAKIGPVSSDGGSPGFSERQDFGSRLYWGSWKPEGWDGFWIYRNHLAGVTTFVSFDAITSKIKETMTYHIQYCAKPPLRKGT